MGGTYKEMQIHLSYSMLYMKPFNPFTTENYVLLSTNKNLLADTSGYIAAHICKAFPSPVPLWVSYSLFLLLLSPTQTCTRGDQSVGHHGKKTSVAGRVMLSVCLCVKHRTLEKMNTSAKISPCISTQARLRESESVSVSNSNIPCVFTNTSCSCHQGAHPPPPSPLLSSPFPTSQANCCSISGAD